MPHGAVTGPSDTPELSVRYPVEIEFEGQVHRIDVYADEFVLDAARRYGITLPNLCRQGWCTRCAATVRCGHLDQSASRRFFEADRAAGYALICTGRPRSPLRLLAGQHEALKAHRIAAGLPVPRG